MNAGTLVPSSAVILTSVEARWLETTFPTIIKAYRQDGALLPPQLRELMATITTVAKAATTATPVVESRQTTWISTAEAAQLLGVSERRVRAMRLRREKHLGAWRFDRDDVLEEARTRAS